MLLRVLRELLKLILLVVKSLGQVLDATTGCFDLLLHAVVLLERCRKLGHPKLSHLIKLEVEVSNVTALRL